MPALLISASNRPKRARVRRTVSSAVASSAVSPRIASSRGPDFIGRRSTVATFHPFARKCSTQPRLIPRAPPVMRIVRPSVRDAADAPETFLARLFMRAIHSTPFRAIVNLIPRGLSSVSQQSRTVWKPSLQFHRRLLQGRVSPRPYGRTPSPKFVPPPRAWTIASAGISPRSRYRPRAISHFRASATPFLHRGAQGTACPTIPIIRPN